jgi:hypothetical protein
MYVGLQACGKLAARTIDVKPDDVAGLRRMERPNAQDGKPTVLICRRRTFKNAFTKTRFVFSQSHS